MTDRPGSGLDLVLFSPRIPQNVGAVGRLCAATRTPLHIVRPVPFPLTDRSLARAGMDYLEFLTWSIHDDFAALRAALGPGRRLWLFSTRGTVPYTKAGFARGDVLVFGSESAGVPEAVHEAIGPGHTLLLPMAEPRARSLNVAMSAGIGLYEAMRQVCESSLNP